MANVTITQLPTAGSITGSEAVPIVQNGVTVQTTTGAIANSPTLNQTFLTVGRQTNLPNSRAITTGTGLTATDGGAQGSYTVAVTGALLSFINSGTGIQVKTGSTSVTNVQIAVGSGMTISSPDGLSGNPTIGLATVLQNLYSTSGTGLLAISGTSISATSVNGTANQIAVTNGTTTPVIGIASNPIIPGTASLTVPIGGTAARPTPVNGMIRYNSDLGVFEGYANNAWGAITTGTGVTSVATGTGLTGGPITSTGTISIANTTVTAGSYTNANITVNAQGQITAASNGSSSSGTVTSVSVVSANGFAGTVASATTTPAITLSTSITGILKGNGTAISAATSGTDYAPATSGTSILYGNGSGGFSNVTVGSGLSFSTGTLSATGGSGTVTSVSFTGGLISVATATTTPALTVAGTSGGIVYFSSASTWASSAVLTANALMIGGGAGTAPSTITTGTGVVTALGVNTGSAGAFVVNGGALGTPSSGTLTNTTGLPISTGVSGLGTGVATALAVNTGSSGSFVVNGGALGTPSSGTLTNATGLPISTGVSGLGTGVATALAVNTGSAGAFVVNGGALGTPSSGTVTNLTGTASININGTVGATTPTTGAFTTLTATGTISHATTTNNQTYTTTGAGTITISSGTAGTIDNMAIGNTTATTGKFTTISASGQITSTVSTGTAPFVVSSTTQVANLNAATAGSVTNSLTAGTGISYSSGTTYNGSAAITINNSGVTSNVAGTGISVSGATGAVTITNSGVTSAVAGTGISVSGSTGAVTITNSGVTSLTGTSNQISVSGSTGSVTLSTPQSIGTSSSVQFGSFGVGTAASGTTGEIRATNNVTAYYSSDIKFKTNVQNIQDPLGIVTAIGSKTFDWTDEYLADHGGEDEYFQPKQSFGVIAQDVQKVFPQAVRTRTDGSLAVDYEKLAILSFGAIGQLLRRVEALESK